LGRADVRRYVESADAVLMLGCFMTDINLGIFTAHLDQSRIIDATSEQTTIRHHNFDNIPFRSFMAALLQTRLKRRRRPALPAPEQVPVLDAKPAARLRTSSVFALINESIADGTIVVTDVGDCLFGAMDLKIRRRTEFLGPAYYASMGFGVPAALGAQVANPALRPLVIVGDGGFQMTGMEMSTMVRLGLNPIVVVLNNHGYTTERQIMDGAFNDIQNWDFTKVVEVIGGGHAHRARTVGELRAALQAAHENTDSLSLIEVELGPYDMSPALKRLGTELGKRARGQATS
jgi:indolepyruvate decarboxylase